MRIFVKVKAKTKEEKVEKIDESHCAVWVKEEAKQGRANAAVIKALAGHFQKRPSAVRIVAGHASRQKIVELN